MEKQVHLGLCSTGGLSAGPFPNHVRDFRERHEMTQVDLARAARLGARTIYSLEKGMGCRMDTKRKILRAFGLDFTSKDLVFPPKAK